MKESYNYLRKQFLKPYFVTCQQTNKYTTYDTSSNKTTILVTSIYGHIDQAIRLNNPNIPVSGNLYFKCHSIYFGNCLHLIMFIV